MTKHERIDLFIKKLAAKHHVDYDTAKNYAIAKAYIEYVQADSEITAD